MTMDTISENIFMYRKIKEQLSIYVDDLENLEQLESNKTRCSMILIVSSILGYPLIWFVFNYLGYHFGFACFCLFIISCMIAINMSKQAELNTIKTLIYSFKRYVMLHLLEKKDVIVFKVPIDELGYAIVDDVLDEIHQFDPTICLVEYIEFVGNKKIKSIRFTNIESEKLKKIINLNALNFFEYKPRRQL